MSLNENSVPPPGYHLVITPYIRKNGKTIFPKNGKYFAFFGKDK